MSLALFHSVPSIASPRDDVSMTDAPAVRVASAGASLSLPAGALVLATALGKHDGSTPGQLVLDLLRAHALQLGLRHLVRATLDEGVP